MMELEKQMNCPECGKPILSDQNFCRECGKALTERRPSRVRAAGVGVIALMFVGLLVASFGKMFEMRWLAYLGLVVVLTGGFIMAAYAFLRETRPGKRAMKRPEAPNPTLSVEKADTTNKLLTVGEADYVPSVIEKTTDLLETVEIGQRK
jgi:predicted nucleic acid-binding Zn ribbon protein